MWQNIILQAFALSERKMTQTTFQQRMKTNIDLKGIKNQDSTVL